MGTKQITQDSYDGGHVLCAGRLGGADGPHGFIGDDQPGGEVPVAADGGVDLSIDKAGGGFRSGSAAVVGVSAGGAARLLPHAQQRGDAGAVGGPDLERDHGIVLGEMPAPFGVPDFDESYPQLGKQ